MRHKIHFAVLLALTFFLLWGAAPARADGIIIPCPPPIDGQPYRECPTPPPCPPNVRCVAPFPALAIKYHRVTVSIDNQIATTHVDQVFINDSNVELEGTYIFPLPEDAAVSDFAMWVDGKRLEAQVLDKNKARQIYMSIVNQRRDPALLEYIGRGAFQARVYPIPARGEKRIELEYKQVLTSDGGLIKYIYPLNTEKFSSRPLLDASVTVNIKSRDAIKAIYSPTHEVSISRKGEFAAVAGWEAKNVRPNQDFALYYSVSQGDIALNLLSYKPESGEDGFFVLLAAPKVEARADEVVAKDVIYVLDVSGSMQGQKIEQAKQALQFVVEKLNPEDRFNIITFSTGVNRYANGLRPASEKREALPFVRAVRAEGSTDINRALLEAMALVDKERPTLIIFMTDGLPTTGVTDANRIIANAQNAAPKNVRLFSFGVGFDVNTLLLDTLSQNLRGASAYIKPNENINEAVTAFYAKVSTPVLADLKIDWGDITVNDIYPTTLPDLFAGSQLVLVGRYRVPGVGAGQATTTVKLSGTVNNRPQTFTYSNVPFQSVGGDSTLARIWATRKIGYLLDQIRFKGAQKEIVDEIVALSVRYGIVTPYTSFLVNETSSVLNQQGRDKVSEAQQKAYATPAPSSGADAVQQSQDNSRMGQSNVPAAPVMPMPTQPARPGATPAPQREAYQVIQYAGDRAFVNNNGVWTDTTYDNLKQTTQKIAFQSADYFKLLDAKPGAARYFALGANMIVVLDGQAYEIYDADTPPQQTTTTPPQQVTPVRGTPTPTSTPRIVSQNVTPTPGATAAPTSAPSNPTSLPACGAAVLGLVVMMGALWWIRRK